MTIRPFMIYGPREYPSKYRSAISNFIHSALTGGKITVHRGTARAWSYISDFIDGVYLAMKRRFSGAYEAFNVGSDEYHTMEEVARMVVNECGGDYSQIALVHPPEKFLSLTKKFSIEKIKSINYAPKVPLEEGIHRVAECRELRFLGQNVRLQMWKISF